MSSKHIAILIALAGITFLGTAVVVTQRSLASQQAHTEALNAAREIGRELSKSLDHPLPKLIMSEMSPDEFRDAVKEHLEYINRPSFGTGSTPLALCVELDRVAYFRELLLLGADPTVPGLFRLMDTVPNLSATQRIIGLQADEFIQVIVDCVRRENGFKQVGASNAVLLWKQDFLAELEAGDAWSRGWRMIALRPAGAD